jgi:flagellin-like protein
MKKRNLKKSHSRLKSLFNNNLLDSKRSQSEIVSSVLLILLVIVAAMLIFAFVVPFVKEKLSSGDCLSVAGKIEVSSGYTCYNGTAMQVQVHILDIRSLIDGFSIELGGASTNNYKILNNTNVSGVKMCTSTGKLEVPPSDNTERTYVINSVSEPNVIRVYPILKGGKTCDASDTITSVEDCYPSQKC